MSDSDISVYDRAHVFRDSVDPDFRRSPAIRQKNDLSPLSSRAKPRDPALENRPKRRDSSTSPDGVGIRSAVCRDLEELGIVLDADLNTHSRGETKINAAGSRCEIWIVPTNEEIIVARQVQQLLEGK